MLDVLVTPEAVCSDAKSGLAWVPDLQASAMEAHWSYTERVMGEVLMRDEKPHDIWDQHGAILDAIGAGKALIAENTAREHITQAASFMVQRLRNEASTGN